VQAGAGDGIDCPDKAYQKAGAEILPDAPSVFKAADMIVKVKEPQPTEWVQLHSGQILFTYLHLAPDPDQTRGLLESGCTAVAYETVTDRLIDRFDLMKVYDYDLREKTHRKLENRTNIDGWGKDRLTPLIAGLSEVMPWVRQWHSEPTEFGESWADAYDGFLTDQRERHSLTDDDIQA